MGWVRVSDDFADHEKFANVGPLGIAVWLAGLAYCNRNLTNGRIPRTAANRLLYIEGLGIFTSNYSGEDAQVSDGIAELVGAGLWAEQGAHFLVHDYLDYQPSRDEVQAQREKNAWRQAEFRKRKNRPPLADEDVSHRE